MDVTVAICTWNRAELLDRTLTAFHQQQFSVPVRWELLVVDNNCTDSTAAIVDRHANSLPLRRVVEPQQGHSHARNRAVAEAQGELILWTDDDVRVSPNWIAEFVRVAQAHPQAGFFGGRVTPWFAHTVPPTTRRLIETHWDLLAAVYSLKDYGPDIRPLTASEGPFGSSMAFRTGLLRRYPFNPRLGRVKTELIGGDEVAVIQAMQADGISGVWIGTTEVQHFIPPDRTTYRHFWRHYAALGQTHLRLNGLPACPMLAGRPRWAVVGEWRHRVRSWWRRQRGNPQWLADYLRAAWLAGIGHEARQSGIH
jgi:glycosyltransferase involved in cell wall biosynthesis